MLLAGFDELTREIEARRRALLLNEVEAERRGAQELEIAKQVQARLFPQRAPVVPGLSILGHVCKQARSVGGDYYDFLDLGMERVALVIGDIAGKGMAAALLMANLQANLRGQCIRRSESEQFLGSVNRLLFENTAASAYATLSSRNITTRAEVCACQLRASFRVAAAPQWEDGPPGYEPAVVGLFEDWSCSIAESRPVAGSRTFWPSILTASLNLSTQRRRSSARSG